MLNKTKYLTSVAMLSALAVSGRYVFQFIPNVQPATVIIILAGMILGKRGGLMTGVLTAIVSSLLTGLGYWTIFQVVAWGLIGFLAGLLKDSNKLVVVSASVLSGYLFGLVMSLSMLITLDVKTAIGFYITGLPFDTYHAVGNLVFILILLPFLNQIKKVAK